MNTKIIKKRARKERGSCQEQMKQRANDSEMRDLCLNTSKIRSDVNGAHTPTEKQWRFIYIYIYMYSLFRNYPAMCYENETFIEEDTSYNIVHRTMTLQSPSKQAPRDLTQFSQSPSAALLYFPESHLQSETSSLSKVILILGKARSCRVPDLVYWYWFYSSHQQLQYDVPSALVAEAVEQNLLRHCLASKSQTQQFLESPDQLPVLTLSVADLCRLQSYTRWTFSGVLLVAGLPECRSADSRPSFNRFLTIFEAFVQHFYFCCTHFIIPESLLNIQIVSQRNVQAQRKIVCRFIAGLAQSL